MTEEEVLSYMSQYLIAALDELTEAPDCQGFVEGEITAYVDCLEILNFWQGFDRCKIADIEKKYQLK